MISIWYVFSSNPRNKYAGHMLLFFLNLYIYGAHGVSLHHVYLRRTIGHLPQKSF
jgi:hypothetical protein